jgi:DNA helicase HerA-like ATPase
MQDFEKLGVFYLGRQFDLDKNKASDDLVLYDSADLVTHAVCIGMTGSGKTGLCLTLLEEAAMDGIPVIAIDPKGDIGNLLLTFPELNAASFAPWVDEDEARREGLSVEQLASREAGQLATWTARERSNG